ncbi:MAG: deoxyribose-phosphate aldolase [Prevotellaceae bacterium]|jgi:deoxyribose-phosphate aldolase|nr:deoxyribose-phosphate aldolase [Prevotellaceae bacterium]
MKTLFESYSMDVDTAEVSKVLAIVNKEVGLLRSAEVYRQCLASVDYTTLNATDTIERGRQFAHKVNNFPAHYPGIPNVAAICVYPALVPDIYLALRAPSVKIAAVGAGFPASQTFLPVKILECQEAVTAGADEIDIVISLRRFLSEDYRFVFDEIRKIKGALDEEAHLKVILETGALSPTQVRLASFISMAAGADFIKTSTGKMEPAATPEAAIVMCQAIKEFYEKIGRRVGFKPAGGVVAADDAVLYYAIVKHILGDEWLTPDYFRIGASRLANSLLSKITGKEEKYF